MIKRDKVAGVEGKPSWIRIPCRMDTDPVLKCAGPVPPTVFRQSEVWLDCEAEAPLRSCGRWVKHKFVGLRPRRAQSKSNSAMLGKTIFCWEVVYECSKCGAWKVFGTQGSKEAGGKAPVITTTDGLDYLEDDIPK